ncbi:MAG: hypothetical protein AUH89_01880 [Ktedonobacter sp. 13_1_40CM_4_52_4]|nr:MAG: hypothetical protein AUH89_01880 [Ktedonobacter sp. 13_1_40CM_4_52_4]
MTQAQITLILSSSTKEYLKATNRKSIRFCKGNRELEQVETDTYASVEWAWESEHEHFVNYYAATISSLLRNVPRYRGQDISAMRSFNVGCQFIVYPWLIVSGNEGLSAFSCYG